MISMSFDQLLEQYRRRFPSHGAFRLRPEEDVIARVEEGEVPRDPGVYLIYGVREGTRELLYVGKSGTLHQDGTFSAQKLRRRIAKGKQRRMSRRRFYPKQMTQLGLDALEFEWFVTVSEQIRIIPAKAEADLLQAYFEEHGALPRWNRRI